MASAATDVLASKAPATTADTRRLIAGPVPADFAPAHDAVIGAWVFAGREEIYPDWERLDFAAPFTDPAHIKVADDLTAALAEKLVADLIPELNRRHGLERSFRFWRPILIRWVLETTQAVYFRYREAETFLAANVGRFRISVPARDTQWNFAGIADFYDRGMTDPYFNAWLTGLIIDELGVGRVVRASELPVPPRIRRPGRTDDARPGLFARAYRAIKGGRCEFGGVACEYDISTKLKSATAHFAFNLYLTLLVDGKTSRDNLPNIDVDIEHQFPDKFMTVLHDVLRATLPNAYGDAFAQHFERAREVRPRPGRLQVRLPGFMLDDAKMVEMAYRIDGGESLIFVQHGANYGVANANALAASIEYRQAGFITWGWDRHGDYPARFLPLPAPQLSPWRNAHRERESKLLLVGGAIPFNPSRFLSNGEIGTETIRRRDRVEFVTGLPERLRELTIYRPYPALNWVLADGPHMAKKFPAVRQCATQTGFFKLMRRCRLMVLDHPGVTFYLALAANVPMVCYWQERHWPTDPAVRPLFGALRRCGVLVETGGAAAVRAAEVWDDTGGWWRKPEIQHAIAELRRRYAWTKRFWWLDWMRALWRL